MKPFLTCALLLLLHACAQGQGFMVPPQVALKTVNGVSSPIAGASITVCPANSAGLPCSPATVGIFSDTGLSHPLSNPFPADANGNYQFAAVPGNYTVTVTASGFAGYSYQITAAMGQATINGVTCFLTGPPCTVTAPATAPFISNLASPASTGLLRGANGEQVCWRNSSNTGDLCVGANSANVFTSSAGGAWAGFDFPAPAFATSFGNHVGVNAASGLYRLNSGDQICWRNVANSADVCLAKNGSDQFTGPGLGGLWSGVAAGTNANAGTFTQSGNAWDFSGASHTLPFKVGLFASIPATCTVGEKYFASDKTPPNFSCTAANTWTQDGSPFYQTVENAGTPLTQQPIINYSGTGVVCSNGSGVTNCVISAGSGTGNPAQYHSVASSATPSFTCSSATADTLDTFAMTLTANVTSFTLTGCTPGQYVLLAWIENGTGGFTVSGAPASVKNLQPFNTSPNRATYQAFLYDGTNFNGFSAFDSTGMETVGSLVSSGNISAPTASITSLSSSSGNFSTSLTVNGVPIVPANVPQTYTTSHTISQSTDNGALVTMNCAAACNLTLDSSPAAGEYFAVQSTNSNASILLNGTLYNGGSTPPACPPYAIVSFQWDATAATYKGSGCPIAGANMAIAGSATGTIYTSNAGGSGSGQVSVPVDYPVEPRPFGLSLTTATTVTNTTSATSIIGNVFQGRNAVPAGTMLIDAPGPKTLNVIAKGTIGITATPTLTLTVLLGGQTLSTISVPLAGVTSGNGYDFDYSITVTGNGSAQVGGCVHVTGASNAELIQCSSGSVSTLNFATSQVFDVQATWSAASASNIFATNQLSVYPAQVF